MLTYRKPLFPSNSVANTKLMGTEPREGLRDNKEQNIDRDIQQFSPFPNDFIAESRAGKSTAAKSVRANDSEVILLVDDTPNNLQVLFSYLEEQGFKVLLAEDGESALQIAQSQAPDLILLDVLMPDIDGFETCRLLKAQPSTKDIPVIFLTALSETVNKVQGFKLGGVDYITKPIEQEEVLARIQTHLTLQKMRHTLAAQNQELQQALNFEALVQRITNKIRDSLDESYILQTATQELGEVLHLSSCQIELYDSEQLTATIAYEHSITLPQSWGETRQIADFPELYRQLLQQIPIQSVEKIPQFNSQGIQVTRLACPIFDDRGIIGNLWGLRSPGDIFTELEIKLMQQMASQCAIAIRQARLYAASNQQVEELAKLNQLKDDFLKTISHELRSPMSSIQLAAQTMESLLTNKAHPKSSPTFNRVLKIFRESCQRQKQLLDDLLTLCYVDAKAKTITPELVDLHNWLPELTQLFFRRTQNQQQDLILDLSEEKLEVLVDPLILERIIRELLNNACKYTPPDGKITIQTTVKQEEISICIINTGVEISPEEQELIFNQFYRIPNNDPWQYGGTGLGLTLVKKLAQILEASIDVESGDGQTVFCIRFPK